MTRTWSFARPPQGSGRRGGRPRWLAALAAVFVAFALASCSSTDPLDDGNATPHPETGEPIVVGSSDYYSAEILAEIFSQVLEKEGYQVDRQYLVGAREVLIPEVKAGKINLIPDYSGNLLQFVDPDNEASKGKEILDELGKALPENMELVGSSEASDQDSFNVTRALADEYGLETVGDLKKLGRPVTIAANAEFEERAYGPQGLKDAYGLDVKHTPVQDSGGPLTIKALVDGTVDVADVYSASPAIKEHDFVTLADPEELIVPQNVVAVATSSVPDEAKKAIADVLAHLTQEDLIALNEESVNGQASAATIAKGWIEKNLK